MVAAHGAVRDAAPADAETGADADRALVQRVQEGLATGGYYAGPPDGVLDEETRGAIRAFERATGLPETGEPSLALLAAVAAEGAGIAPPDDIESVIAVPTTPVATTAPPTATATASQALGIADVQRLLNTRGYGPLSVDGKLGPATREALKRFSVDAGFGAEAGMTPAVLKALAGGAG
jgi:peptidoglycan hydrolase-like protein with peptidoglycan-binding domain